MMVSGNMPAFSAYLTTTNQSITTSTSTKVTINAEEFDTNNFYDSTTNYRFTPTISGYYQITGLANINGTTITTFFVSIYKNGSEFKRGMQTNYTVGSTGAVGAIVSSLIYFNGSTDYVELWAFAIGTSPYVAAGSSLSYFQGAMIRAA